MHPSTSLAESQTALEAHGCKSWVTSLSTVPPNVAYCRILLEYVNESQVNMRVAKGWSSKATQRLLLTDTQGTDKHWKIYTLVGAKFSRDKGHNIMTHLKRHG